jgi:hypothetical protein
MTVSAIEDSLKSVALESGAADAHMAIALCDAIQDLSNKLAVLGGTKIINASLKPVVVHVDVSVSDSTPAQKATSIMSEVVNGAATAH